MDYRKEYMELIFKVKAENRVWEPNKYFRHHILPKSLFPLWKKRKSNIILLTREEHLKAHTLLAEIYPCLQMIRALQYMKYEPSFEAMSKASKKLWENDDYRKKVTESNLKFWSNEENKKRHRDYMKEQYKLHPEWIEKGKEVAKKKICQKVRNIETGKEFNSCVEAAIWAGVSKSSSVHIGECCRNERIFCGKTPDGKMAHWEYIGLAPRTSKFRNIEILEEEKNKKTWWSKGNEIKLSIDCPGEGWEKGKYK